MSLNLKAAGAALLAVLAIMAVAAPAAMAHDFKSEERTVLTGESKNTNTFTFANSAKLTCSLVDFSGTMATTQVDTITLHPTYHGCKISLAEVTVKTTGCNYVFGSDTTASTHLTGSHASVSIECEASKKIEAIGPGCTVTIGGVALNQSLHGVTYVNEGISATRDIKFNATVRTIHYEASGMSCGLAGIVTGTQKVGMYDGSATVQGWEDKCQVSGEGKDIECPFVPAGGTDADEYTDGVTQEGIWIS
jgi:hypothetical protein